MLFTFSLKELLFFINVFNISNLITCHTESDPVLKEGRMKPIVSDLPIISFVFSRSWSLDVSHKLFICTCEETEIVTCLYNYSSFL